MAKAAASAELEKLGGIESALATVLNEDHEGLRRETAALAIANASRDDENVCCAVLSRETRAFRNVVNLLWDDNATVCRNGLRLLCNCTFVDLDAPDRTGVRASIARFVQETDWISSLISILKSDPTARKNSGLVLALNLSLIHI